MLLVILEHENGQLVEAAREALTFGRVLAEKMGEDLEAALIGSDDDDLVEAARPVRRRDRSHGHSRPSHRLRPRRMVP